MWSGRPAPPLPLLGQGHYYTALLPAADAMPAPPACVSGKSQWCPLRLAEKVIAHAAGELLTCPACISLLVRPAGLQTLEVQVESAVQATTESRPGGTPAGL